MFGQEIFEHLSAGCEGHTYKKPHQEPQTIEFKNLYLLFKNETLAHKK